MPIETYLARFPDITTRFRALIGLADAVDDNSAQINVEDGQIVSFRRVEQHPDADPQ